MHALTDMREVFQHLVTYLHDGGEWERTQTAYVIVEHFTVDGPCALSPEEICAWAKGDQSTMPAAIQQKIEALSRGVLRSPRLPGNTYGHGAKRVLRLLDRWQHTRCQREGLDEATEEKRLRGLQYAAKDVR